MSVRYGADSSLFSFIVSVVAEAPKKRGRKKKVEEKVEESPESQEAEFTMPSLGENVIAMGTNDVSEEMAFAIIDTYDSVTFEQRHQKRIK